MLPSRRPPLLRRRRGPSSAATPSARSGTATSGPTGTAARTTTAAAVTYVATCALGASVRSGLVDTTRVRWLHHAAFVVTAVTTGAAVLGAARARLLPLALALVTTAVPLAALTRVSTRSDRHAAVALSAAPSYATAVVLSRPSRTLARKGLR